MYAASYFKRVVNIPRPLSLVVGCVVSGALYLGGVMTVNHANKKNLITDRELRCKFHQILCCLSFEHLITLNNTICLHNMEKCRQFVREKVCINSY